MSLHIFADYHTHTSFSHGTGTIEENILQAYNKGLSVIGISEHGPANLFGVGVKNSKVLLKIHEEIEMLNRKYKDIHILFGVEANIISLDGDIDIGSDVLDKLDYLLVGLHLLVKYKAWAKTMGMICRNALLSPMGINKEKARTVNTQAMVLAVKKHRVFAVTHPGLKLDINTRELAAVCRKRGTALEINARHENIGTNFIEESRKEGVSYLISSDAHSPCEVGNVDGAIELVKLTGININSIINASH